MTQIQDKNNNNSNQNSNQPADLNSIYRSLTKLTQSIPTESNHVNEDKSIKIPSPLSLIALTCHAFLISNSFHFKPSSNQNSNSNQDSSLLTDWDSLLAPDQHSLHFNYSHIQSSLSFEFTFSKIGNRISIAGITVQDDRLSTWHLLIAEYVEPSDFPMKLTPEQQTDSNGFRSSTHLLNFISLFVNEILNRLLPDLFPISTINQRSPPSRTSCESSSHSQAIPPDGPHPPTQLNNHIRNPLEIGRSDLEPIGTSNLHIPSLYNHIPRADLDQRSGMMVHPTHPIFNPPPRFGQAESFCPPGARFDPMGPNPSPFSRPRSNAPFDFDPMGGLGQGLPVLNPHMGGQSRRPDFNEFLPPGGPSGAGGSGYDNMFM